MLSSQQREQVEQMISQLEASASSPFPDEMMKSLLGEFGHAEYMVECVEICELAKVELAEVRNSVSMPGALSTYRDRLGTYLQQHKSMTARLPKLNEQLQALLWRIKSHEDFLSGNGEQQWADYDRLTDDEKRWCTSEPSDRKATNQPKVYDKAPWEVALPGRPLPIAVAQMAALKRLLDE